MKIKVPLVINIGNFHYKVQFTKYMKSDEGWQAACNQRKGQIEVDPDGGDTMNRSFLHEVVHLVDLNYGVDLDEKNINRIANGLAEFLFDNLDIELDWSEIGD